MTEIKSIESIRRSARAAVELLDEHGVQPRNPFCEAAHPEAHIEWKLEFMRYGAVDRSAVAA
jgi:hypothetical protein